MSLRQVLPLLVIAFLVGSLFRLYAEFGIGFFRMFGTLGIVVMGVLATRLVTGWQLGAAAAELESVFKRLPAPWRAMRTGSGGSSPGWTGFVGGPGGTLAVATCAVANYARGRSLKRSLAPSVRRAKQLAGAVPEGFPEPVVPCVVLLRRRADKEAEQAAGPGVRVLDLDGVAALATGPVGESEPLAAGDRREKPAGGGAVEGPVR
ncbi:MAG: hypothetical protein H0Z37_09765 [Firmicutes bacterium]|nr:hypothetical protein [Bacillota bacterium]